MSDRAIGYSILKFKRWSMKYYPAMRRRGIRLHGRTLQAQRRLIFEQTGIPQRLDALMALSKDSQ